MTTKLRNQPLSLNTNQSGTGAGTSTDSIPAGSHITNTNQSFLLPGLASPPTISNTAMFQNPAPHTIRKMDLSIEVPPHQLENNEQNTTPIDINMNMLKHYEILQLPTPIFNTGSFANYNQPLSSLSSNSSNASISMSPPTFRLISRVCSLKQPKRYVSEPIPISTSTSENKVTTSPITPSSSPPTLQQEEIAKKEKQKIFYSKRLGLSFNFVEEIGKGNFSHVVLAKTNIYNSDNNGNSVNNNTNDNQEVVDLAVAVKIISVPMESKQQVHNFKSFIRRELNILYHISHHPCITSLIDYDISLDIPIEQIESDVIIDDDELYQKTPPQNLSMNPHSDVDKSSSPDQFIFMNYCNGGNLLHFLQKNNSKHHYLHNHHHHHHHHNHQQGYHDTIQYWQFLKRIVCELIVTTAFLHKNLVIHRDLKLENILLLHDFDSLASLTSSIPFNELLMSNAISNLSDFGLSKKLATQDQLLSTRCGSQDYIAPEILMGLKYNGKLTDTWSIGVIIYSILENRLPFDIPPPSSTTHYNSSTSPNRGSPTVIKRRRSKTNSTAYRIAMIDWEWSKLDNDNIERYQESVKEKENENDPIPSEVLAIWKQLKSVVDTVLVRKEKRINVEQMLQMDEFKWITDCLPDFIVNV